MYRFLLYSDGLTPPEGKKRSMGGFYMLPIGINPNHRGVNLFSAKDYTNAPGVSTKVVLDEIVDDTMEGKVISFEIVHSDNEKFVLFLDYIGFTADYPTACKAIDMINHIANAPCHLCLFSRYDMSSSGSSAYGYSKAIGSLHSPVSRTNERMEALRESAVSRNE